MWQRIGYKVIDVWYVKRPLPHQPTVHACHFLLLLLLRSLKSRKAELHGFKVIYICKEAWSVWCVSNQRHWGSTAHWRKGRMSSNNLRLWRPNTCPNQSSSLECNIVEKLFDVLASSDLQARPLPLPLLQGSRGRHFSDYSKTLSKRSNNSWNLDIIVSKYIWNLFPLTYSRFTFRVFQQKSHFIVEKFSKVDAPQIFLKHILLDENGSGVTWDHL